LSHCTGRRRGWGWGRAGEMMEEVIDVDEHSATRLACMRCNSARVETETASRGDFARVRGEEGCGDIADGFPEGCLDEEGAGGGGGGRGADRGGVGGVSRE
jgi:hypothetical protein